MYFPLHFTRVRGGASGRESTCQCRTCGNASMSPGLGRSPGKGNGKPLQYSCLGNPMDREALWATVDGVAKSRTWQKQLSMHACSISAYGSNSFLLSSLPLFDHFTNPQILDRFKHRVTSNLSVGWMLSVFLSLCAGLPRIFSCFLLSFI